jgi:3',5'-cyclic-AMP phosphodiesterase
MSENQFSRRDMLRGGGALAAGALVGSFRALGGAIARGAEVGAASVPANRKRSIRLAHLTDVHVQPELGAGEGMIACLHHVQELKDKPDLILNGGDAIMDSAATRAGRVSTLWKLWTDTLKNDCSLPVESVLGNHDIFGWNKKNSHTTGEEANYGKAWGLESLGLAKPYHSFDKSGWHFIGLDSVQPTGADGTDKKSIYEGRLDPEQFEWLAADLKNVDAKMPVCVWSHIPIFSAAVFLDGDTERANGWEVPSAEMHIDARKIKDLFAKHPNVKLCMSGHLHLVDRVDIGSVTYFCNGAVSGNWWKGRYQDCNEGYAVVDLFDDGSFERQYIEYGWKARKA